MLVRLSGFRQGYFRTKFSCSLAGECRHLSPHSSQSQNGSSPLEIKEMLYFKQFFAAADHCSISPCSLQ